MSDNSFSFSLKASSVIEVGSLLSLEPPAKSSLLSLNGSLFPPSKLFEEVSEPSFSSSESSFDLVEGLVLFSSDFSESSSDFFSPEPIGEIFSSSS
jgi:hypothetical protein